MLQKAFNLIAAIFFALISNVSGQTTEMQWVVIDSLPTANFSKISQYVPNSHFVTHRSVLDSLKQSVRNDSVYVFVGGVENADPFKKKRDKKIRRSTLELGIGGGRAKQVADSLVAWGAPEEFVKIVPLLSDSTGPGSRCVILSTSKTSQLPQLPQGIYQDSTKDVSGIVEVEIFPIRLEIRPGDARQYIGSTKQLRVIALMSDFSRKELFTDVVFYVEDQQKASVDENGLLYFHQPGRTVVVVSYAEKTPQYTFATASSKQGGGVTVNPLTASASVVTLKHPDVGVKTASLNFFGNIIQPELIYTNVNGPLGFSASIPMVGASVSLSPQLSLYGHIGTGLKYTDPVENLSLRDHGFGFGASYKMGQKMLWGINTALSANLGYLKFANRNQEIVRNHRPGFHAVEGDYNIFEGGQLGVEVEIEEVFSIEASLNAGQTTTFDESRLGLGSTFKAKINLLKIF